MNKNTKYTNVAIALHWLIGIAILFMFVLGLVHDRATQRNPKDNKF
jgi:cytochrome b561